MKSMIRTLFIAIFCICSVVACVDSKRTKIERVMRTPLKIPTELSDSTSIINIIRYIKPKSCTSCELDLGMWRIYKKNIHKKFGEKATVKLIVETTNVKETTKLLSMYNFRDDSFVDSIGIFIQNNPNILGIGSDVAMLVDNQKNVILIGNPCRDIEIQHMADSIITERVFSIYNATTVCNFDTIKNESLTML